MSSELPLTPSRRDWMRTAGGVALALATPGWLVAGPVIKPLTDPPQFGGLESIDLALAQRMVGQHFEIASADGHAICELIKVSAITAGRGKQGASSAFSMEFRPVTRLGTLLQDTYLVAHPTLGTFDLFLVPHPTTRGDRVLVATFARL